MPFRDTSDTRHDLSGRAVPALEGVSIDEGGLQRVQFIALGQAFDSRDLASFDESCKRKAGLHALAIHEHRAGATLTKTTAFLRAGQMQVLA